MSRNLKIILADLRCPAERSTMFWWFVENHDAIVESAAGQRIAWATMAKRLADLGLTDRNGASPKPNTARITWFRARRAVVAAAARMTRESGGAPSLRTVPRDSAVRPIPAEVVANNRGPGLSHLSLGSDGMPLASEEDAFPSTGPISIVSTAPSTSLAPAPVRTPAQIAHRDAMLAKARARLAHTDRFLNLGE